MLLFYILTQISVAPLNIVIPPNVISNIIIPPSEVTAYDNSNDGGDRINVEWSLSPDDSLISGYEIWRSEVKDSGYYKVGYIGRTNTHYQDIAEVKEGVQYYYEVRCRTSKYEYSEFTAPSEAATSSSQWYNTYKTNVLIGLIIFSFVVLFAIFQARKGKTLFIRKINGLDALDEAVGRATEMGRPVLYVPGLGSIGDIATIAAINILSQVAKKTAEYNTPILVPNCDPIVMSVTQEVVKEAYLEKGRPEGYNPDNIFYLVGSQFPYAAGVGGIMMREKPATNLFMGTFMAEALILAETGNISGAVQIAGTDAVTQLPFFITSCDYTIMGEELYAASAYLSQEPMLVSSIKGQDYNKLILIFFLILGSILGLINNDFILNWFHN
ncbi:MAG: fibronectin type III domain-containing protein [bacterium]|nr:fibronectin type III domain-containing protein [bacterium]